jgi:predicted ribosome quality control (RQC) complex YloA/Tae2 family protein
MSLRADELPALLEEINEALRGQPIRRVLQADADTLLFRTRGPVLCLSVHPQASRVHLLPALPETRIPISDFGQLLRRRLEGTRVASLTQPGADRAVRLGLRGPRTDLAVVAELTGRHGNVFLLENERILGSLWPNRSRRRPNAAGATYVPLTPRGEPRAEPPRFDDSPQGPSAAVAAYYAPRISAWALQRRRAALARPLKQLYKQKRRLAGQLAQDLERHQQRLPRQRWADLLLAQPAAVQRGADYARLPDLFAEDPERAPRVEIPLDPRRSPAQNAQRFYEQAARARRGIAQVENRQVQAALDIERLEQALAALAEADEQTLDALEASQQAAPAGSRAGAGAGGAAPAAGRSRRGPGAARRREPWHTFRSEAGLEIRVGRGAQENDRLTFRSARGRDLWLHARDVPGAHVVIRLDAGGEPDSESLLDAATLAAQFSDARAEGAVDVSWTAVKHLRRGHRPGQVYLSRERTLRVRPDPERLARLRRSTSSAARALAILAPDSA